MAAAAGKKVALFFFAVNRMEVEEEMSTVATLFRAGGARVRGLAGAATCETRDLSFTCPQWHILVFDEKWVCRQDVKKLVVKRDKGVTEKVGGGTGQRAASKGRGAEYVGECAENGRE